VGFQKMRRTELSEMSMALASAPGRSNGVAGRGAAVHVNATTAVCVAPAERRE
jgi:hypothetical protein